MYAVTNANTLVTFNSTTPGTTTTFPITGLAAGAQLVAIDFRPSTGILYGLSLVDDGATRTGRLYTINPGTGAATAVGGSPWSTTLPDTLFYGFNFDPHTDVIRITNNFASNFRVSPTTGALVSTDTNLSATVINGISYTNNDLSQAGRTLYGINFSSDQLVRIGGVSGTPPADGGAVSNVGSTGIVAADAYGFEITAVAGVTTGFATANGKLYTVDLSTGAVTLVASIGAGTGFFLGLTAALTPLPTAVGTAPNVTASGSISHTVSVTYTGSVAMDVGTINTGDITITGPGGFTATPAFVSVNAPGNGTPRTATYSFTPPGGTWDAADQGTYSIVMQGAQVADTSGGFVAPKTIGTFFVNIPPLRTMYAVSNSNTLLTFNSTTPGTVTTIPITGLLAGTQIVSIDTRPATGVLYGLGLVDNGATRSGRLYTINPANGAATAIGAGPWSTTLPDIEFYGFNFDPNTDVIRVTNRAGSNFRLNPTSGALIATDTNLSSTGINGISYTNNDLGQPERTLYGLNFDVDKLVRIGGLNGTPSPDAGAVTDVGTTGIIAAGSYAFEITSSGGTEAAFATASGNFYTVNLSTGILSLVAPIGAGGGSHLGLTAALTPAPVPPTAAGAAPSVLVSGGISHTVTVTYTDNIAMDAGTINTGDITVTGPSGFSATPAFVSANPAGNGTPRTATYTFTPPGGSWDLADNGNYSIVMQANQVADTAGSFVAAGAIGSFAVAIGDVTAPGNPVTGVGATAGSPTSTASTVGTVAGANNYPAAEGPANAIDNNEGTKFLNFAETGVGLIVTPQGPQTVVNGIHFFTANDAPVRDPMTVTLEGTNSPNATTTLNSTWTTIYSGVTGLGTDPGRMSPGAVVNFANTAPFTSYRMLVTSVRDGAMANSFQFSEIALLGTTFIPPTPQTFTVTNLNDAGAGSLRQAILNANANSPAADTINFQAGLTGTITLTTGELVISDSVTINGPGAGVLSVSGNNANRVLTLVGGALNLSNLTITGGNSASGGGGILVGGGNLILVSSTITGNSATDFGGGINILASGTATITNSTISGNTAPIGGGIVADGTTSITNSTVSGNTATSNSGTGGGIDSEGNLTVTNSTITGNQVPNGNNNGGGILKTANSASIINCTITQNSAAGVASSSGLFRANGAITIRNSIVAANQDNASKPDVVANGGTGISSNGFNRIGNRGSIIFDQTGDLFGTGATPLNPLLGPLANNGGPTQTHALLAGSPAIDKGSNVGSGVTTDQRGLTRPRDLVAIGNAAGGDGSDIGAYEEQNEPAATPPTAIGTSPNVTSALTSQTVTVTYSDDVAINASTVNTGDITVVGPAGTVTPTLVSVNPAGDGTPRTATYTFTPVTGRWRSAFNGTYNIVMQGNQVADTAGSFVAAGTIGSFTVNVPSARIGDFLWSDNDADGVQDPGEPGIVGANVFIDSNTNGVFDNGEPLSQTNSQGLYSFSDLDPGNYSIRIRTVPLGFVATTPAVLNFVISTPTQVVDTADFGFRLVVTDLSDAGPGSLRQTILTANANTAPGAEVISFQAGLTGTITLTSDQLSITDSVTINGPGLSVISVSGNNARRVFETAGGTTVSISGLTITNGSVTGDGGGIRAFGTLNLSNCAVTNNSATGFSGGIDTNVSLSVTNCTISGNTAPNGGGIASFGTVNIVGSTISGNTAAFQGGGLNLQLTNTTITNSTISGNSANTPSPNAGGGISFGGSSGSFTLQINNSTIVNNLTATANSGGGLSVTSDGGANTAVLKNTIVAGNAAPNLRTQAISGGTATITSQGFNLTNDPTNAFFNQATDQFNTNPLLGPLANNGGPTQTHALLDGSPAIDKGKNADPGVTTDQRGLARTVELASVGNAAGGDGTDIGAFEVQAGAGPIISGLVSYGTAPAGNPRFVPGVLMTAAGSVPVNAATNAAGAYSLSGFGAGGYTVTPSKSGDVNGSISGLDAARVAQHVAGLITLTPNQQIAGDATNNGSLSGLDAARIAQFAAGLTNPGIAGQWKVVPVSKNYPEVTTSLASEDYQAILIGDVTGNWTPPAPRGATGGEKPEVFGSSYSFFGAGGDRTPGTAKPSDTISVELPAEIEALSGALVRVPVQVSDTTGKGVAAYEFTLEYDPSVLAPSPETTYSAGTLSDGWSVAVNTATPGKIKVVAFGTHYLTGPGTLLNLNFKILGFNDRGTRLKWSSFQFNENEARLDFQALTAWVQPAQVDRLGH
jgi:hypothetical protein